ncbi:MAG: DUF4956 domain-containing protein [Mycoplasmatota bacterium]
MSLFDSVISSDTIGLDLESILIIIFSSLFVGIIIMVLYNIKSKSSKSFLTTLASLPAIVAMIIVMVNGNIGTGVAVAGAFSLIRFRSSPGTAREIGALFLAMASGITLGMGYVLFAILFTVILSCFYLLLDYSSFGNADLNKRILTITIPEDLNYVNAFDEIFDKYTDERNILSVKSTNMGSMFKLKYSLVLNSLEDEKEFIDELRCRNGNLDIMISIGELHEFEL